MGIISMESSRLLKGFCNGPIGIGHQLTSSVNAVRIRAPQTGNILIMWGDMFSTVSCGLVLLWGKEDRWSSITPGALTRAVLAAHSGHWPWLAQQWWGCVPLALIEGAGILQTHYRAQQFCNTSPFLEELSQLPRVYLGRRLPQLSAASRRKWPFVTATMGAPLCSLPDYLPQREGWLPGGPGVLQRGPLLCPLIPGWVWGTLAALMGGSLLYQGTNAPTHM